MTAEELIHKFNTEFSLNGWPLTYEVDAATYGNCCQYVFNKHVETSWVKNLIGVFLGENKGLKFKNVELIIKND